MAMTLSEHAKRADTIYFATLQEAKVVERNNKNWPAIEGKFRVTQTMKGIPHTGTIVLSTPESTPACGIDMLVSARYVIFKKRGDNSILACDGSGVLGAGVLGYEEREVVAAVKVSLNTSPKARLKQ